MFQATSNCSDLFHSHSSCGKSSSRHVRAVSDVDFVVFTVGSQSAEECKALKFCNGPLKAGTDYYIKLRAFTAAGFTDTAYSAKVKTGRYPILGRVFPVKTDSDTYIIQGGQSMASGPDTAHGRLWTAPSTKI